jgi:hypothetical protein
MRDYRELLRQTAIEMEELANKITENGTERLSKYDRNLLKMATYGLIKDITAELEMFYLTENETDFNVALDDLRQIFKETSE